MVSCDISLLALVCILGCFAIMVGDKISLLSLDIRVGTSASNQWLSDIKGLMKEVIVSANQLWSEGENLGP